MDDPSDRDLDPNSLDLEFSGQIWFWRGPAPHHFVTVLDLKPLDLIQTLTVDCFQFFDGLEPKSYLDSPLSVPVFIDLAEWEPRVLERAPDTHGILFRGVGIEAAVRPPSWAPLLRSLGQVPAPPLLVTH